MQARKTLDEKPGAAEQHQRERDLSDDESIAQTISPCALGRTSAAFLECFSEFRSRAGQPGSETEDDSDADANRHRNAQHDEIDIYFTQPRHGLRADCLQQLNSPQRENNARSATDQRQQHAFSENLLQQPQSAGTERDANCDLAFARSRTRKQHRGEIRARDQQNDNDSANQDEQRRPHPGHRQILQRQNVAAETVVRLVAEAARSRVIIRMFATHLRIDGFDFRLRLRN